MDILLVEDDLKLALLVEKSLSKLGYNVTVFTSIRDFLNGKAFLEYDLLILDLLLGNEFGRDLLSYVKRKKIDIPVIVLSSVSDVDSKVDLLQLGADDYLTKPFEMKELDARIKALLRRQPEVKDEEIFGDLRVFWKQNRVLRGSKEIELTAKEGDLLRLLLRNKGRTVSSNDVLRHVWGAKVGYHSNVLQSMVRRLRHKIDDGFAKKLIRNVHGVGYMLDI